jgi:PKD repeat protein
MLVSSLLFAQSASWVNDGPVNFPTNVSGQINGIGRTTQLKFHPTNPNKMYATTASGGMYYSNDNGTHWILSGTDSLPHLSCASICIDFTDDHILYLGTGDPNYYGRSYGIYKSVDAGISWAPANTGINDRMALEILMDPTDHNTLIAATDDGIWKTTDAGAHWTNKFAGDRFTDMIYKPGTNGRVIYACSFDNYYRSLDRGETWSHITSGLFFPFGSTGGEGCRLGVSESDSNVVYLGMVTQFGSIFKSVDGGSSFVGVKIDSSKSLVGYDSTTGGQGNYNFDITVDPANANIVYLVSHNVWRSMDGGIGWEQLTNWWATVHTDMHHIVHHPFFPSLLYDANDGGVWMSNDMGIHWVVKSDGIAATEIYHAAQSHENPYYQSIGTQDNGELYSYNNNWFTNRGGDWGSKCDFDYLHPKMVYYYGNGQRRDVTGSESSINLPFPGTNSMEMSFSSAHPNIGFAAKDNVWLSRNLGAPTPTWTQISTSINRQILAMCISNADSNLLYVVTDDDKVYRCTNALGATPNFTMLPAPASTAFAASIYTPKQHSNVVYISCGNQVFRSINQGGTWTNITGSLPPINIIKILGDDYDAHEAVYAGSAKGVYYRSDTSSNWLNYSKNLPTISDIQDLMMYNDGGNCGKLVVSYYGRGMWETPLINNRGPQAAFTSSDVNICSGQFVNFQSIACGSGLSYHWRFPGGTPSSATTPNPSIQYNSSGNYDVVLTVSNSKGTDSLVQHAYVHVDQGYAMPLIEGFEGVTYPPAFWNNYDAGADNVVWFRTDTIGAWGRSQHCLLFDDFHYATGANHDEMRTPKLDFSRLVSVDLRFDYAYCLYAASGYDDSMSVLVSTDCGNSFTTVWANGSDGIATAPNFTGSFIPTATQWDSLHINLSAYAGMSNVIVAFQNRGHYGQNIYVDNINITGNRGAIPVLSFSADDTAICVGDMVNFSDSMQVAADSIRWTFSGGTPNTSTSHHVSVQYNSPGLYPVALRGTNAYGTDSSAIRTAYINVEPYPSTPVVTNSAGVLSSSVALNYQWYHDTLLISGANAQTYHPSSSGTYSVEVRSANGCSSRSTGFNYISNISGVNSLSGVGVFPNPSNGVFDVRIQGRPAAEINLQLIDMLGAVVCQERWRCNTGDETHHITCKSLAAGAYQVDIISGDLHYSEKMIIQP